MKRDRRSNRQSTSTRVEQVMSRPVFCCGLGDTLNLAAQLMWEHDCGIIPVVNHSGHVEGVVTDRDICMAAYTQGQPLAAIPITSAMSRDVFVCGPGDSLDEAERLMHDSQVRRVPVVDGERHPIGILSLSDIAHRGTDISTARERLEHEVADTFASITTPRHQALGMAE